MTEYKSVYDLTRDQLDELKAAYFWNESMTLAHMTDPAEIPDSMIYLEYEDTIFTDDDFFCSGGDGPPMTIPF